MIMNKIINKVFPILTLALVLSLSACLNDSDYSNNLIGTKNTQNQNFVEVHITSADNSNIVARAYSVIADPAGKDTTITQFIAFHLTSGPATSDVTITYKHMNTLNSYVMDSLVNVEGFVLDSTMISDLNTGLKVVIPKGSSTGYISVKLNPNKLIGSSFIFGVRITAVSDPKYTLSNLNEGVVKFGPANDYDGHYAVEGTFFDAANALFTGRYPMSVNLVTQSVSKVDMWDNYIGTWAHSFLNNGGGSYYGSFAPSFKFDASTHKVIEVTNHYGQPAGNGRSAELDPSGFNDFDPVTRTIRVSYWMNQPAVVSPHRTHFVEVFTYIGPR